MPRKKEPGLADTAGTQEKRDPAWKAFLTAYLRLGNVARACEASEISHDRVRRAYLKVPEFREAFDDARQLIADRLEDALRERAVEGVERLKFDKNGDACLDPRTGLPYIEKEFSDHAAIFLLKGLRPERYRERYEYTGREGGPMETKITNLADLVRFAAKLPEPQKTDESLPEPKK